MQLLWRKAVLLLVGATLMELAMSQGSSPAPSPNSGERTPPFWLGYATSAPQIEGANATDGKGPSIWDVFATIPGKIKDGSTGALADDFYHRYTSDIQLMQSLGVKRFRMSIAWTRIYPQGDGSVNQKGLDFYAGLINNLLAAGIEPHVTLYHWDLPQALQERFGGWNSSQVVEPFRQYAKTVFSAFGNRIKHWTTMNEPQTFCFVGYSAGSHAPGIRDQRQAYNCVHNVLKAHAAVVQEFRTIVPGGKISINLNSDWGEPYSASSPADKAAAQRMVEFWLGTFADPIYLGDWPASVKARIPYIPTITPELAKALNGSCDYFALNHYTSWLVMDKLGGETMQGRGDYTQGQYYADGSPLGNPAQSDWLKDTPWGFRKILNWVKYRYQPKELIVTENGFSVKGEASKALADVLDDTERVAFYRGYVNAAIDAVEQDQVPMTGYFAWSLLTNWEWAVGYTEQFGVVNVDFKTEQRALKASARYLASRFAGAGSNTTIGRYD
ncbi:g6575 [Coccomyxa viridis]|uniref:G6575 protein n=1 Tax=Coccomyxa viridis TaxID=1274662 RepID=A0ABP1FVQ8_9CHLO